MRLLINEWFINELLGDNGPKAQEESANCLKKLIEKGDQIVILEGSPV